MKINPIFVGLNIASAKASPGDCNFLPGSWPPVPEFPISLSSNGTVISRYEDEEWDLTLWAGQVLKFNFGKPKRKNSTYISSENSSLFKLVIAYWLFGPNPVREIRTLKGQYENIRQIFAYCSKSGISANDLYRFPKVVESLADNLYPSQSNRLLVLLHTLWEQREHVGISILDDTGIALLRSKIQLHEKSQTAYIPPRIWLYQLSRLKEFLQDFEHHSKDIEACTNYCLHAYVTSAGDMESACTLKLPSYYKPFASLNNPSKNGKLCGAQRFGPFHKTASRFNILELLEKWCGNIKSSGVAVLSQYLSMATHVGKAYLLNFTLMRIEEVSSLRANCLVLETDKATNETIYLVKGATSKTVEDDQAYWITSPSSQLAINVMTWVSEFRTRCASFNKSLPLAHDDLTNPYLELRPSEPWRRQSRYDYAPVVRKAPVHYGNFNIKYPKLFDAKELMIQKADFDAALLVTPSLDAERFAIGNVWPLSWHQLRRTGAVNMSASGIVGDASIQYQLKHVSRAMTRYYGQGFYHLDVRLNQEASAEYVRGMYEAIAKNFAALGSSNFVSPHGDKRKEQLVEIISSSSHAALIKAAKNGSIIYRDILLGSCANPKPCPYGGIDYIGRCGGGDGKPACMDLLIDKNKKSQIQRLGELLSQRIKNTPEDSPLYVSIQYQQIAVGNILNVI